MHVTEDVKLGIAITLGKLEIISNGLTIVTILLI